MTAAKLQNGGIDYYFSSKEEIILVCAEEAINRIEENAFSVVLENVSDIQSMMDHLVMHFVVSVCVTREYGEKIKPSLIRLASKYPYYTEKIAEILNCSYTDVEPFVHLSILALNNYMIFTEKALFESQIESAKN